MGDNEYFQVRVPGAAKRSLEELRKLIGREFRGGRTTKGGIVAMLIEDELNRRNGGKGNAPTN